MDLNEELAAEREYLAWLRLALEAYVQEMTGRQLSPATRATYMSQADRFVRWVESRI